MPSQGTSTTDVVSQNGPSSTSSSTNAPVSPELEQILSSLTTNRSVLGYIVLTRTSPIGIVRHSGVVFDGEQGKKYASAVKRIVDAVRVGLEDVSGAEGDELKFMRVRTKRHELIISPDERYLLAVIRDPSS